MSGFIEKLSSLFENFPGIGQRQAKRFVYHLIDEDKKEINELVNLLKELENIKRCSLCYQAFEEKNKETICPLCRNKNRNQSTLLVVEKDLDFINMEKTKSYDGLYFILGGSISPLKNDFNKKLRVKELFSRVQSDPKIKEVIIALSTGPEGEMTGRYIQKILEPVQKQRNLKITKLGRGLHTGADLEYLDQETIKNALENRK